MNTSLLFRACLALILTGTSVQAIAADRAFVGKLALAVNPDGQKRLQLSDEAKQKLLDLIDRREQEALSLALDLKDLPPDQRAVRLAPFVAESERLGMAILTVEQRSILDQLRIAEDGMESLLDADLAKVLGLSEDQQSRIRTFVAERQQALTHGGENDRRTVHNEFERKLAAVLTQEQRANWEKLAGLSAGELKPVAAATKSETEQPNSSNPISPAVTSPPKPDTATQEQVAEKKPANRPTVGEPARMEDGELLLKFNFQHAPWKDVLEWFAEQSDLSLQIDNVPPGTCNYRDTRSFTPAEAIDLMNSMLLTKGYTLVRYQRLLTVMNLEDPIPPQLVELVPLSQLNQRGDFELIKVLIPLSKMETSEAEAEIAKLIGPQGNIVALPKSRQLLVTETAGRLRTIREVIAAVEDPQSGQLESVREIVLKHVEVEAFLTMARPLLGLPEGQNQSTDIRIALDPFSTRMLATGIPAALKRLDEIVQLADRPMATGPGGGVARAPLEQPQLETYQILKADPTTVHAVLSTLLAGLPDVRLAVDPENKKVIALARPAEHRTIVATLRQLEGQASQIEVIQLRRLDPQLVILSINKMFGAGSPDAAADAPKVDGDPTTMKLVVRGAPEQIKQIKDLVEKLEGPRPSEELAERQPLRYLPLTGSSARSVLDQVEAFWPTMRENKIRVVTPSSISPTLRQQNSSGDAVTPSATSVPPAAAPGLPPGLQLPPGFQLRFVPSDQPPAGSPTPPPAEPSGTKGANDTLPKRSAFQFASFQVPGESAGVESPSTGQNSESQAPGEKQPAETSPSAAQPGEKNQGTDRPEILVTVTPQGIFIASSDLDALDEFEKVLRTFMEQRSTLAAAEPTIFWLKFVKADVASELLTQILTGAPPDSGGGSGGSLLGDVASSLLGDSGGLLGGLLGGGSGTGTVIPTSTTIVPDVRLNCLIVQGRPQDILLIEQLLPIIDREGSPEEVYTFGRPRLIPVIYMSATEMSTIVKQVFGDRVAGNSGGNQQQRQPSPEEFINALRGRSSGRSRENRGEVARMTIGVDTRSNALIVAAPEPLFKEVEDLVRSLDVEGNQTDDSMIIVSVKNSNPATIQKALTTITGGQVKGGTTTSPTTSSTPSTTSSQPPSNNTPPPNQPSPDDIRRRIEMFRSLQGGGGPPNFGGGFGGFGGRPSFGGGFGGGDRSGGDRGGGDRGGGDRGGGDRGRSRRD